MRARHLREAGKQTGEMLQKMRTLAALKGLAAGVGPVGRPK